MCCRRNQPLRQDRLAPNQYRKRGCCGPSPLQQRIARELEAYRATHQSPGGPEKEELGYGYQQYHRTTMAGMLVIGLGIGAEKLGKKISDKRAEKKARKTAEVCTLLLLITEQLDSQNSAARTYLRTC